MPLPCNNVNVFPIKVSQLVRYSNLDGNDILLTVESGSSLLSRHSTINDLKNSLGRLTGSYSGSFTGSFKGEASGSFSGSYWGSVVSKNTKASGSFSGSYWGNIISKNTKATGSFSGSHYGKVISKNTIASGSFSGSYWGRITSKNALLTGSFSGSHYGNIISKNTKASGSFSGSHWGSIISKNTIASGSFSGSYWGSVISKNTKATGSFKGSIVSTNTNASGSFSGSYWGRLISKNSKITGSFKGIDNILNFKGTGKKVSVNATSSYAVSSSYSLTASYIGASGGGDIFANAYYNNTAAIGTPSSVGTSRSFSQIIVPTGKKLKWFKMQGSFQVPEEQGFKLNGVSFNGTLVSTNIYSSWGWGKQIYFNPDSGNIIVSFTIEGAPPVGIDTGTISVAIYDEWFPYGPTVELLGYVVGYF